jgi:hypothetical protein
MEPQDRLSRRMTLLFLAALILVAWQALRIPPLQPLSFERVWKNGEQVLPVAVPPGEEPIGTPLPLSRLADLQRRSVEWSPASRSPLDCEVFFRISRHHWSRLRVNRAKLAELLASGPDAPLASSGLLRVSPRDLLEDRDGDGDLLDPGELRRTGEGIEAELFCSGEPGDGA